MTQGPCTLVSASCSSRSARSAMTSSQPLSQSADDLDEVAGGPAREKSVSVDHGRRWSSWSILTSDVIVVGLLGFTFLIIDLHPMFYSDIWGHLKYGEWIWAHGCLPDREPFTPFADQRALYVNFQWLCQALFYLLYHAGEMVAGGDAIRRTEGGVEWLRAFHAGVEVCRFVLLLVAFRRRSGSAPLACAWLALSVLLAGHGHLAILRPQIIGEALFAGLLLALSRPVLSRRAVVGVPLMMVVWANTHGSFTIGLALLGLFMAGRAIDAWFASNGGARAVWTDPRVRRCFTVLVASVVAIAILNPHGPWLYWYTLKLARHPNIATMIEWSPLGFDLRSGWHWNYLGLVALAVGIQVVNRKWFAASDYLLLFAFGVPPLFQQRMMVWWMMVAPWVLIPHFAASVARIRGERPRRVREPSARKTLIALQLLIVTALLSAPVRWLVNGHPESLENSAYNATPWQVVAELRATTEQKGKWLPELARGLTEYYPDGRFQGAIFSSELLGDYLLWGLATQTPIIVYSHAHLFAPAYWLHFRMTKAGMTGYERFLDYYHVNLVVIEAALYPELRGLLTRDPAWLIVLDETGTHKKPNRRGRLLVALRKKPRS
jgi:hypothetical protein